MIQPALELPRTNTIIFAILDFLQIHKNYIKFWGLTSIFTRTFAGVRTCANQCATKGCSIVRASQRYAYVMVCNRIGGDRILIC